MLSIINRIFKIAGEKRNKLILAFGINFLENICAVAPLVLILMTLNDITSETLTMESIWKRLFFLLAAMLGQYIFKLLVYVLQDGTGFEIMAEQRIIIGERLRRLPMGCFSDNNAGNISAVVTNDMTFVETFSMQFLSKATNSLISSVLAIVFVFVINWKMGMVVLAGYPFAFILNIKIQKYFRKFGPERQQGQADVVSNLLEYIQGIPVIKAFNLAGSNFKKLEAVLSRFEKLALNFEMKAVPWNAAFNACFHLSTALILYMGSYLYFSNEISMATMMMFVIIAFRIYMPAEAIAVYSGIIRLMDACLDRLQRVMDIELIDQKDSDAGISGHDIEFKNVSFSYGDKPVIKDLSFKTPQKTMTAIVGPSGSGKTTITSLIARFWDVQEGEVLIGGVNVKDMKCDSVLSHISMVFQDVYLFNDTILNNIKFGNSGATMEQVIEAAKNARCHDFISSLENGYDTVIGEGGDTLSGGEKQRISIARAMLKDAPVIMLDEATSSIDPENEKEIQEAISLLVKNKTLIVIAHRLSTVKKANQILVLNQEGMLAERGTHEELLEEGGIYAGFWTRRRNAEQWKINTGTVKGESL